MLSSFTVAGLAAHREECTRYGHSAQHHRRHSPLGISRLRPAHASTSVSDAWCWSRRRRAEGISSPPPV